MRPLALLPRPGRARRALLLCAGVLTGGVFGLVWWVDRFGRREHVGAADALVVLGARVLPGVCRPVRWWRAWSRRCAGRR
ncbi:hypothetical protein ACLEQD_44005, partial [Corallococcus sp. 4LFB]